MSSVLNTAFYLPFGIRQIEKDAAEASLVQDLLCYDTIFVLTDHMSAAGTLSSLMGVRAFETALEMGVIRFVHDRQIIAWSPKTGSARLSPLLNTRIQPTVERPSGFTEAPVSDLSREALQGFGIDAATSSAIANKISSSCIEITDALRPVADASARNRKGEGLKAISLDQVDRYMKVVPNIPSFPVTLGDLIRLKRDLSSPKRSPLNTRTIKVIKTGIESGWHVLDKPLTMNRKQVGLLNLYLSEQFLLALAAIEEGGTLHTEPVVEKILNACLTEVRSAAGDELAAVLRIAQIDLPVLSAPGPFPYDELLKTRDNAAAKAFRRVVGSRDMEPDNDLSQAYYAHINESFGSRIGSKSARFLLTSLAGLIPGLGTVASAIDTFLLDNVLKRRDPRFYIDETLRRLTPEKKSK